MKWLNTIHQGHALDVLRQMPDGMVDCVITSPPYWGLRSYGTEPIVWGGDIFLVCATCNGIIRIDRKDYTIKEVKNGANNPISAKGLELPNLRENSKPLLQSEKAQQKAQDQRQIQDTAREGLLQEPQHEDSLHGRPNKTAQPETQHGSLQHKLERRNKASGGIQNDIGKESPPFSQGLCDGTPYNNRNNNREIFRPKGKGSSYKWNQERQPPRKSSISSKEPSPRGNKLPFLPQDFPNKIICPICQQEDLIIIACRHEWGSEGKSSQRIRHGMGENPIVTRTKAETLHPSTGQFCRLCGAWRGELGREPDLHLYLAHLMQIFDEVRRVLKPTGTLWVNIGDSYGGSGSPGGDFRDGKGVPAKSLCGIPERFVLGMADRGWIRRNTVIWHKPNPMPSSASDRFSVDFEYVYFLVKQGEYYFEQQFEPMKYPERRFSSDTDNHKTAKLEGNRTTAGLHDGREQYGDPAFGRNKRCVWTIPTFSFAGAHFATFPPALVEPMVRAGCPEFVCPKCGKGREKIYSTDYIKNRPSAGNDSRSRGEDKFSQANKTSGWRGNNLLAHRTEIGVSDCGCGAGWAPGVVLDLFAGACTTGVVAKKLKRNWIMIELSESYCKLGAERIAKETRQSHLIPLLDKS